MCLGIPGRVVEIQKNPSGVTMGRVNFEGVTKAVNLAPLPEVCVGDYILVHYGLATSRLEEEEAQSILKFLKDLDSLGDEGGAP
jgi:hydrogenase expression/formation protein HypC